MQTPVVVVTGASAGIGAALARILATTGASVSVVARSATALDALVTEINEKGSGEAFAIACDLSEPGAARDVVEKTLKHFGRIDTLLNNAATIEPVELVRDVDLDRWWSLFALNLRAPAALCHHALPALRETDGRIVNVVSLVATLAVPALSGYGSSKAALIQFTRTLAVEEPKLTIVGHDPGPTDSDMMADVRKGSALAMPAEWADRYHRMKEDNILRPAEIPARVLAWLALECPHERSGEIIERDHEEISRSAHRRFGGVAPTPMVLPTPPSEE